MFGVEPAGSWLFDGGKGSFERHACQAQLPGGGAAACNFVPCHAGGASGECWSRCPGWLPALHGALTANLVSRVASQGVSRTVALAGGL